MINRTGLGKRFTQKYSFLPLILSSLPFPLPPLVATSACEANLEPGHFLDLLATSQGRRLDEQRASVGSSFPGLRLCTSNHSLSPPISPLMTSADKPQADDVFFDMLVKCQVIKTAYSRLF